MGGNNKRRELKASHHTTAVRVRHVFEWYIHVVLRWDLVSDIAIHDETKGSTQLE